MKDLPFCLNVITENDIRAQTAEVEELRKRKALSG